MKIKETTRYYLADAKKSIIIYYFVMAAIYTLNIIATLAFPHSGSTYMNNDSTTIFFLFIVGLCSFKENYYMMTQMGVSRKSMFFGRLISAPIMALGMAICDRVMATFFIFVTKSMPSLHFETMIGGNGFMGQIYAILLASLISLFVILLGNFITILYFRLNTLGKVVVSVGTPILLQVTIFAGVFNKRFEPFVRFTAKVFSWIFTIGEGTFYMNNLMITLVILSAAFAGFAWLLLRRATVKR